MPMSRQKLAQVEPQIEATLKTKTQSNLTGRSLVFAFEPIRRN